MAGCPSGQREQTVNLPASPTLVRTQHLPHQVERPLTRAFGLLSWWAAVRWDTAACDALVPGTGSHLPTYHHRLRNGGLVRVSPADARAAVRRSREHDFIMASRMVLWILTRGVPIRMIMDPHRSRCRARWRDSCRRSESTVWGPSFPTHVEAVAEPPALICVPGATGRRLAG